MTEENMAPDVIMWVGKGFYPTIDDYITESLSLGCAKRIPMLPADIVPGKSRCFLGHDEGKKGQGVIFGFFTIRGVDIILDDEEKIAKYQEEYSNLNVHAVPSAQARVEPRRLCGQRSYGAAYLVSEDSMDKVWDVVEPLADKADTTGSLAILMQRIPYPRLRFRGWRYMEPQFLAGYDWPQTSMPVKRTVKIEHKPGQERTAGDLPLFPGARE